MPQPFRQPLVARHRAQPFRQNRQQRRRHDHALRIAHAAEDDHDHDVHRAQKIEALWMDELLEVRIKAARDPREKRAEDKREHLVFRRVDAHRLSRNFIVPHREKAAPVRRAHEIQHRVNRERRKRERPKKVRVLLHPAQPALRAERLRVLDHALDDLVETQRHNREVVALQAQRRHTHQQPRQRRADPAGNQGQHIDRRRAHRTRAELVAIA